MSNPAGEPLGILDYAPTPLMRSRVELIFPIAQILTFALLGAVILFRLQPLRFTADGFVSVPSSSLPGQRASHVAGLKSFAPSILPPLQRLGLRLPPSELAANLRVAAIPGSRRLIIVSFTANNGAEAAYIANDVISSYTAQASGITISTPAAVPAVPQRNALYPISGAAAGAIFALILGALQKRSRIRRARLG